MGVPPVEAFAYPLLLAATYGVYRLGRQREPRRVGAFEWARLATLTASLTMVTLLHIHMARVGLLDAPWATFAASLGIVALLGLVGLEAVGIVETARRASAASGGPQ